MGSGWAQEFPGLPSKNFTAVDLSAAILSKLISVAQQSGLDLRGTPHFVVLGIPANFNDAQKRATREAAELAGLEVLYLLEEPVAAALVYARDKNCEQTILVYDLGGGTFDVAILEVRSSEQGASSFKILAKEGIRELGGDDFDGEIMKLAAARFKETSGIDILDLQKDQGGGISAREIRKAQQKIRNAAEAAKCELSEDGVETADITIPSLLKGGEGKQHNLDMTLSREDLNNAIRPFLLQTRQAVGKALESAKMGIEGVSRIVLSGGSTRIPLVKEMLREQFGKEPYSDLDPDTAVARGAAIQGACLELPADKIEETGKADAKDKIEEEISIQNIVSHFLGIEIAGGRFSCLLQKGDEIPTDAPLSAEKEYTTQRDNMSDLRIAVYQANDKVEFVVAECAECIGEIHLTGIPPRPRGQERVLVTFSIDQQNLLKVVATGSGNSGEIEIRRS